MCPDRALGRASAFAVFALVVGLSACGASGGECCGSAITPPPSTPVLTTVSVSLNASILQVGWIDSARVDGFDQRGAPFPVGTPVWSTASSDIAIVDANGLVEGVAIGQTTLIATVDGKQGRMTLDVVPVVVTALKVDPPSDSVSPGQSVQLTATTLDGVGDTLTGRIVQWSSTMPNVATVSAAGLVTAVTPGISIIEATSEEGVGNAVFVVAGAIAPGVTIAVGTPTAGAILGDTLRLVAAARSANHITGVVATVGTRELPLTRQLIGASGVIEGWIGTMLLSGMAYGPMEVVLKATDSQNVFGVDSVAFTRIKTVLGGKSYPAPKKDLVPVGPRIVPRP